ncbi:hypothetical protein NMY22_g4278 [Coprinellus aureogranulatus]|nr:hypothetical protein NMY22_g4278 [Coprinellus aureogranulatus]
MPPSRSFIEDADSFLDDTFMADDGEISRVLQETEAQQSSTDTKILQKSLRNAHIALSKAQAESLELRKRFMELKATVIHLAATKRQERRSKKAGDSDDDDDDTDDFIPEDIKELARYLRTASKKLATLFVNFWSDHTPAALTANPMPPFEWDNATRRFASHDNMILGQTAELYACTPERFHDYLRLNKAPFCTLFYQFASKHRSNTSNRLRNAAAAIFGPALTPLFDAKRQALAQEGSLPTDPKELLKLTFGPHMFKKEFDRDKCDIFLNQIGYDRNKAVTESTKGQAYSKWPVVLYEDGKYDPGKEFRNPLLFRVARVKIYGPSAVDGERSACRIRDGSPMAGEELQSTIGLIANTAFETCWLLSGDTELNNNGVGNRTGIDYPANVNSYKFTLLSLQEQNPAAMKALLDLWDKEVFPNYAGFHSADSRSTTVDNSTDIPPCPILSDQEHFAQMQAAMARAQISNPAPDKPADSARSESSQHQGNTPNAGKSVGAIPPGDVESSAPQSTLQGHRAAQFSFLRNPGRSASLSPQQNDSLAQDNSDHPDHDVANTTFLDPNFLNGLRHSQHSTPAPRRRPTPPSSAAVGSIVAKQNPRPMFRLSNMERNNSSATADPAGIAAGGASPAALPANDSPRSEPPSVPSIPDIHALRVTDLKDWCVRSSLQIVGSKPPKAALIALIKSSGKYPTEEQIRAYKAKAREDKEAKASERKG